MTTITHTVSSVSPSQPAVTDGPSPLSTRFSAAAMVVGPFALLGAATLLGSVLKTETVDSLKGLQGNRGPAIAYVNLFVLAQGLLTFAWLRIGAIVARGSRRLGLIGGTLLAFAMVTMAVYNGIVLSMAYAVQGASPTALAGPFDDVFNTPNIGALAPFCIVIGSICLAVGAFRSGMLPRVRSIAIGLFALVPIALLGGVRPALIVAAVASIVALVPTGISELRSGAR